MREDELVCTVVVLFVFLGLELGMPEDHVTLHLLEE
jgi:hypothetical protein